MSEIKSSCGNSANVTQHSSIWLKQVAMLVRTALSGLQVEELL